MAFYFIARRTERAFHTQGHEEALLKKLRIRHTGIFGDDVRADNVGLIGRRSRTRQEKAARETEPQLANSAGAMGRLTILL